MKDNLFKDEYIKELIELRNKLFRKKEQKAELLKRSPFFLKEFNGISKRLGDQFFSTGVFGLETINEFYSNNYKLEIEYPPAIIIKSDEPVDTVYSIRANLAFGYGKESEVPSEWIQKDRFFKYKYDLDIVFIYNENPEDINIRNRCKLEVLSRYIEEWIDFCHKWSIGNEWKGDLSSLHKFIKDVPQIVCRSEDALLSDKKLSSLGIEHLEKNLPYRYLFLKLDAWTALKDIKTVWPRIEKLQKTIFDYKAEEKANFSRDLCWFDLHKKKKLSFRKIARLWMKYYPPDIDEIVLKTFKRERLKEIKELLKGETSVISDSHCLLEEITKGRLKESLLSDFLEDKEFYVTGESRHRKFTPPFIDTIKQAIKRMEKYIELIRPAEYLISLPPPDEKLTLDEIDLLRKGI